jgi:O-antigen/teichoic acid export membrane protein
MAVDSLVLLVAVVSVPVMFRDPVMAMALYTGSNFLGAALLLWSSVRLARKLNTEPVGIAWSNVRSLIATSAPLALYLLLNALHVTIDSVYLKLFQTYEAVGVYNAALRIMTPLAVFPTIVAISASPAFARASMSMDDEQRRRMSSLFSLGMKTLLIGSVLLAGFGLTNADLVVKLAFKSSFADATVPMALMFLTFLPMSLNIFLVEINNARDQLRTNTSFAFLVAVVSLTIGAPLIIWQGAAGAAVAKMVAVCVGLVFLLLRSREGLVMAVKPLLGKVLLLLLLLLVPRILLDGLHPLLSNGVALLCVVSGMVLLRIYNPDELSRWKEQLRGLRRVGG